MKARSTSEWATGSMGRVEAGKEAHPASTTWTIGTLPTVLLVAVHPCLLRVTLQWLISARSLQMAVILHHQPLLLVVSHQLLAPTLSTWQFVPRFSLNWEMVSLECPTRTLRIQLVGLLSSAGAERNLNCHPMFYVGFLLIIPWDGTSQTVTLKNGWRNLHSTKCRCGWPASHD